MLTCGISAQTIGDDYVVHATEWPEVDQNLLSLAKKAEALGCKNVVAMVPGTAPLVAPVSSVKAIVETAGGSWEQ